MNTMTYRNYAARVEYDDEDKILVGHIDGIRDIVGFHAESVAGLEAAFQEAVNNYLRACEQLDQSPDHPVDGAFHVPVAAEVHDSAIFDLNDIEQEPTDEQLAGLMEAVALEARRRGELVRSELLASLKTGLTAAMPDARTHEPS
jgi:predicted HicB family RNase H-like nuclease